MTNETTIHARLTGILVSLLVIAAPTLSLAGEIEDQIIDKTIAAYGGTKLTELKSISIKSTQLGSGPGQGYTPFYDGLTENRREVNIDLVDQRGSDEFWTDQLGFFDSSRAITVGDKTTLVNYHTGKLTPVEETNFYGRFGAYFRVTDTLLAYELNRQRQSAKHLGSEAVNGVPHEKISFEFPSSPTLTLFINPETGLISQMQRVTPFGALTYLFTDYRKNKGITYSADFTFYAFKNLVGLTLDRKITFNRVKDNIFKIEKGMVPTPEALDTTTLTIEAISPTTHHVGSDGVYTMFIDAGDHIIGIGGFAGLKDRYTAYLEETGHEKPLKYQVVTHHHEDHIAGLLDAAELGAILVTTEMAKDTIQEVSGAPDEQLQIISTNTTLGPATLHIIDTNHTAQYVLLYLPTSKTLFQADHYGGEFIDQVAPLNKGSVRLHKEVTKLGLDVEKLVSAHNRKIEDWAAFSRSVADFKYTPCPMKRKICR